MRNFLSSKIAAAFFLLLLVFIAGVFGFRFFFDYLWIDAIYMTMITITTVGYGELHPLSPAEKLFVSLFILSSIFIVGYAISTITEYIISKNKFGNIRQKTMQKKINALENHVVICGYGRNGKQAAQKLIDYKRDCIVVEKDDEVVERFSDHTLLFVHGDASEDHVLIEAGIKKASTLICALPSDADNLFIVLSARQINKNLKIISRATEETSYRKLKLAGADNVIMPDKIGGEHMASLVVVPDLVEFLDNLTVSGDDDSINVEQVSFEQVCANGEEQSIAGLDLRHKTGCSIIGYKSPTGEYIVNPEPALVVKKNSKLILIGTAFQIERLKEMYNV